ncbi:hypothetical protein [Haloferax volcanii]|uniref:hypothetical protein n=1 Tax=Haloferax volcanii TaxID=2246 RepID=UPI00249C7F04|nr:hypothetical protein [Haloferax alexandrinus]
MQSDVLQNPGEPRGRLVDAFASATTEGRPGDASIANSPPVCGVADVDDVGPDVDRNDLLRDRHVVPELVAIHPKRASALGWRSTGTRGECLGLHTPIVGHEPDKARGAVSDASDRGGIGYDIPA